MWVGGEELLTWRVMCLKHPIGIFGVGDDEVVPFDL